MNAYDALWTNSLLATCDQSYGLIEHAAIATKNNKIAWIGKMQDLKAAPELLAKEVYDMQGACITPGLIDCHTHLIYAGNRFNEFERRIKGATYAEIAREGDGIQATVAATRAASFDYLLEQSLLRARTCMLHGVTTLEIKSGYGLNWQTEQKILRVAKALEESLPLTICKTFLAAHTIPLEYQGKAEDYVRLICETMIPEVAKEQLADAIDVFCENIAFNLEQTEYLFQTANNYHLALKCHAEQLSASGAAMLAAKYHALSADHLEYLSQEGVKALAKSGTVAVLLPGAFYFLRESTLPPIPLLREHHVPIAIATDCNPGTSPVFSLLTILNMACILFGLTPEEALLGVTYHAAKALGLEKTHGRLKVGMAADFAIWNISHPGELAYYLGLNPLVQLVKNGEIVI